MIQAIIVIVILGAMIMILLGIDQLFTGRFNTDKESIDNLRNDVEHKNRVITSHSVFKELIDGENPKPAPQTHDHTRSDH